MGHGGVRSVIDNCALLLIVALSSCSLPRSTESVPLDRLRCGGRDADGSEVSFLHLREKWGPVGTLVSGLNRDTVRPSVVDVVDSVAKVVAPESCIGDVLQTGYTHTADGFAEDDYPYMPICSAPGEANELFCFPSSETVMLRDGETRSMKDLVIGDVVMSHIDSSSNQPVYEPVIAFLHRDVSMSPNYWLKLTYRYSAHNTGELKTGAITLSQQHLLFVGERSVEAKHIHRGDFVDVITTQVGDRHGTQHDAYLESIPTMGEVVSVQQVVLSKGVYAPLTSSGRLVVNGVAASCYSAIPSSFLLPSLHSFINITQASKGSLLRGVKFVMSFIMSHSSSHSKHTEGCLGMALYPLVNALVKSYTSRSHTPTVGVSEDSEPHGAHCCHKDAPVHTHHDVAHTLTFPLRFTTALSHRLAVLSRRDHPGGGMFTPIRSVQQKVLEYISRGINASADRICDGVIKAVRFAI